MERRLGERHLIPWADLRWSVARRKLRRRMVEERVEPLDVSTTGIGVRAKTVEALRVGSSVELHDEQHAVRAHVRRIVATPQPDTTLYGLEFVDPPVEFLESLFAQSGVPLDARHELYWRHAV